MRNVYFNGKLVPENEAKISIYDSALMFGDMVFEMTRSFNKSQFKLREHIDRLFAGIKILRIPLQMTPKEMELACYETIEANEHLFLADDEHRLMIDVSRGLLGIYQGIEGLHKGPNVIIADFPLRWTVAGMGALFDGGINAVITSQRAIPGHLLDPKIKNRSRIHYLMANIEAGQIDGENNWALLLDPDGFIAEGTGDNFFIIKNGEVITPEGRNILRGISRDYVMQELCPKLGMKVVEKNIEAYDVYTADEAFMTGTPFCILPVTSLNGNPIGNGLVGEGFNKLISAWGGNTGIDIIQQIKRWDLERVGGWDRKRAHAISLQGKMKKKLIGFMQGRLCDMVDGKVQAFPWLDWDREFSIANSIDFHIMEWTLDHEGLYENPLMTKEGQKKINDLCGQFAIAIPSLTGDCFMQAPFWKANEGLRLDLQNDFLAIIDACSNVGIRLIVLPLVDNGRLETSDQEDNLISFLIDNSEYFSRLGLQIVFESDFPPKQLKSFISKLPAENFGINYDIGNSAANGYDPLDEFASYGARIKNVHVKDRVFGGATVPLKTGNADFDLVFGCLAELNYQGNFILQTARASDGDHVKVLVEYRDMVKSWLGG